MATEVKVAQVRHAASVPSPTHKMGSQHGERNVINAVTITISVHIVDTSQRANGMAKKALMVGTGPRDHEAKVDALDPDLEQTTDEEHSQH